MKKKLLLIFTLLILFSQSVQATRVATFTPQIPAKWKQQVGLKNEVGKTLVLMYHRLSENPKDWSNYCISPKEFEKDIKYLKTQGYQFLTVSELKNHIPTEKSKTVVLTFDDGYASDYSYALPILKKYDVKATFFIVGMLLGSPHYMDEKTLKILAQSPYVEIGNHSYDLHKYSYNELKNIIELEPDIVVEDYKKNADYIKKITGKYPVVLSYPYGLYTDKVDRLLKKSVAIFTLSTEPYKFVPGNPNPTGRLNRAYTEDAKMLSQLKLAN